ncbi:MAG: spore coat associated protein CotJA [Lachnospiraceae bacterium]|nr:spore coat associated protein CotJA [Lachnospiraceae bacterium]
MEQFKRCPATRGGMAMRMGLDEYPLAMDYVPWQYWHTVYDLEKGLSRGTIFPELYKPFLGVRGGCR